MRLAVADSATIVGFRGGPTRLSEPEEALLVMADPGLDGRVVIIVPGALELSCALLERGHREVTMVRVCDRPLVGQADVVIIPRVTSAEGMQAAVACARRMLAPLGTIVIRLAADLANITVQSTMRQLLLHGCAVVRTRFVFGDAMLRAELPLYGQLKCA